MIFSHGWAQAVSQIRPSYMKVICPTAATIPVTLNAGFQMPSWFDLRTLDMFGPEDADGIRAATANIQSMIQSEISAGKKLIINHLSSNVNSLSLVIVFFFIVFFQVFQQIVSLLVDFLKAEH